MSTTRFARTVADLTRSARRENLTITGLYLLSYLHATGSVTRTELAKDLGLSTPAITGALDSLTTRGLITSERPTEAGKGDRRENRPNLTPAGHELVRRLMETITPTFAHAA